MENPYASPATKTPLRKTPATLGFTVSIAGLWAALLCGQLACWIRGGWLGYQLQREFGDWRLPMYFWFHMGSSLATAFVIALLVIPITRSGFSFRTTLSMYGICSLITVFYETSKPNDLIEPPTHAIIVVITLYTIFMLSLAVNRYVAKPAADAFDIETLGITKQ